MVHEGHAVPVEVHSSTIHCFAYLGDGTPRGSDYSLTGLLCRSPPRHSSTGISTMNPYSYAKRKGKLLVLVVCVTLPRRPFVSELRPSSDAPSTTPSYPSLVPGHNEPIDDTVGSETEVPGYRQRGPHRHKDREDSCDQDN